LLVRLGSQLAAAAGTEGRSYRLGGDEFCVLVDLRGRDAESLIEQTSVALTDAGDGFAITNSFGTVFLPLEAGDASAALSVADQRLYTQKRAKHSLRGRPHEVLLQALYERHPEIQSHLTGVGRLSRTLGAAVGLEGEKLEQLVQAALLHDIGKIAVPDAILRKSSDLDPSEWAFIERHTIIGERILAASPALQRVGRIVRSTHEQWDGAGYPDRLAGEGIPLEARIISICDAYAAMVSGRPYNAPTTHELAVAELDRCAGSQFDPQLTKLLCELLDTEQHGSVAA
jgi:HD-GYP domain-containing protein (c-di-GMP phosphodiesterase class II)